MGALLKGLWDRLKSAAGYVFPIFARARDLRGRSTTLLWVLHVVLVAALLVGLYFLNRSFVLLPPSWLPVRFQFLRESWLPLLVLLGYLLVWLGWWLWQLLGAEEESSFPDIDEAWDQAVRALSREGISLNDVPLFVVLGKPVGTEEALFTASGLNLSVRGAPHRDAPVRVYGNRDGVYVTCPGASLTPLLTDLLSREAADGGPEGNGSDATEDPEATLRPGRGGAKAVQLILGAANRAGRPLTAEEQEEVRNLVKPGGQAESTRPRQSRTTDLLRNEARVEERTARLKHLCRLIVRDRRPYCPLNGILLLIPLAATDHDKEAEGAGTVYRKELTAAREVFRQHCPLLALVGDLDRAPGYSDFIKDFSTEDRKRRLGQRFPLVPELEADKVPAAIDSSVGWICQKIFPGRVYEVLGLETPGLEDLGEVIRRNAQLYWLLSTMHERQKRLSRILIQAVIPPGWTDHSGPLLFGGCYLAATGRDQATEQAFVPGVFTRLLDEQSAVCWAPEALAEDETYRRWARVGFSVLGGLAVLTLLALFWSVFSRSR